MATPSTQWMSTPNKTDHLTKGYTSKVLFNYNFNDGVSVGDGNEVFKEIQSFGENFKGSNGLPNFYFNEIDDGRCFRISMYFFKNFDSNPLDIKQIITSTPADINYDVAIPIVSTPLKSAIGGTLCKYEVYINQYRDAGTSQSFISGIGSVLYSGETNGSSVNMLSLKGVSSIPVNTAYKLGIINNSKAPINVINLMIEEIS
jgi:hypothetical protein